MTHSTRSLVRCLAWSFWRIAVCRIAEITGNTRSHDRTRDRSGGPMSDEQYIDELFAREGAGRRRPAS